MLAGFGIVTAPNSIPAIELYHAQQVALEHGVDLSAYAQEAGVPVPALAGNATEVPADAVERMFECALSDIKIPAFGFKAGRRISMADHGILGYAYLSCKTARDSLETYFRFQQLLGNEDSAQESMSLQGEFVTITSTVARYTDPKVQQYYTEYLLGEWCSIIESNLNRKANFIHVRMNCAQPSYNSVIESSVGCSVEYDCAHNEYLLPASLLGLPLEFSDAEVAALSRQQCETALNALRNKGGMAERVCRYLVENPGETLTPETVASGLKTSYRSLRRRLQEEGTTFRELYTRVRMQLAADYLLQSALSVEQVADEIGYADRSSFQSTFKKWSGLTPTQYRQKHQP
ncbi:AraC family transcriptional regulator [Pseudomaricurvus alkylphenolicus]|uniref:AraC family transcriptional regulator n=1 Tax=Pseudomaricurvus alkylphenolicus TaxID=1306991 RepID=UPI0014219BEA|nr:AraC family transcriptional regulator [Pseudomaricurvus alkylphenolicus]NIB42211.1 AraC family transcriptional regulator [Pseudomaricurvus alkylphenolicus]